MSTSFFLQARNTNGETVPDTLLDILNKLPSHGLQSEQGSEAVIRDIESKVIESFEDLNDFDLGDRKETHYAIVLLFNTTHMSHTLPIDSGSKLPA
jgi:hypothetical protein